MKITFDYSNFAEVTNEHFWPYFTNKNHIANIYGGRASSKSHSAAQKHLLRIQKAIRTNQKLPECYTAFRKTQPSLRRSVVELIDKYRLEWGMGPYSEFNKTEMRFDFIGGHRIYCLGLDNREKLKSIEGINSAWCEEANELTLEDIVDIDMIVRAPTEQYHQITLSYNPMRKTHPFYDHFFKLGIDYQDPEGRWWGMSRSQPDTFIHKSTYRHNKFLVPGYGERLEALKATNKTLHSVYAEGEWGDWGGLIFQNWEIRDLSDIRDTFEKFRNGLDFGFHPDPFGFVRCGYRPDRKEIYILNEVYGTGIDNDEAAEKIYPIITDEPVFCDSAEPKSIRDLRRSKHEINARAVAKGKDSVKHGIRWLQGRKIIVDKSCTNFITEIGSWEWAKDKNGKELGIPVDKNDHLMSALRYAFERDMVQDGVMMATDKGAIQAG